MLVYYILAEKHPVPDSMANIEMKDIDWQKVSQEFKAGKRPSLAFLAPPVQEFIQRCWLPNPSDRPTFTELS